ncbi:cellulose synthase [Chromatiales bacterium (ex Bugula neritina AB1)]|nr:cellulose synthase [Chromatiales bacterium (ex Bugula neritina AB1)]
MSFYFSQFENRRPEPPLPHHAGIELLWQYLAVINLIVGGWYLQWRWTQSLNPDAIAFSLLLVSAETMAYVGLILFTYNLWKTDDTPRQEPPVMLNDVSNCGVEYDRPVSVDIFFPTFDEDPELVRLSVIDAKNIAIPTGVNVHIHVLDDGKRQEMQSVASSEQVNYLTRADNAGFKAGNLRNAMESTSGDFIVICDADTRLFPTFLQHTLGYFRDHSVAWVQTPQWFYDIPEGTPLPDALARYLGRSGRFLGNLLQRISGEIRIGQDPLVNDPKMFYDVILRRRNWCNASFCCGAGSIHRREAVMEAAVKAYGSNVSRQLAESRSAILSITGEQDLDQTLQSTIAGQAMQAHEITPYKFHVSEDIYTSIALHTDADRRWKSVLHPQVESRMLSPQDLLTWTVQRFKYAGGTLDIAWNDNPLFRKGLTLSQRLMYATTIWSYLGCIWNAVFLLAPLIYLFTAVAPVSAYSADFYIHIVPFLILTELAFMTGTWGLSGYKAKTSYLSFFPVNLRALYTVLRGRKISFPVTPKIRQEGNFLALVIPQMTIILLTISGIIYSWGQLQENAGNYELNGVLLNTFWGLYNIMALSGVVVAALWKPDDTPLPEYV